MSISISPRYASSVERGDRVGDRIIEFDADEINALSFSRDGRLLAAVEQRGQLIAWSIHDRTVELRARIETRVAPLYDVAISPDGELIAAGGASGVHLFRASDATYAGTLYTPRETQSVAFSPCGRYALSAGEDGEVCLWSLSTLSVLDRAPAGERNSSIIFHPDQTTFAVTCSWQGGSELRTFALDRTEDRVVRVSTDILLPIDTICGGAFSPDGRWVAVPARELVVFDTASGRLARAFDHDGRSVTPSAGPILLEQSWTRACFTRDGHLAAATPRDGSIFLFDVTSGTVIRRFAGHTMGTFALDASPDARWLASTGYDATVRLWSLRVD